VNRVYDHLDQVADLIAAPAFLAGPRTVVVNCLAFEGDCYESSSIGKEAGMSSGRSLEISNGRLRNFCRSNRQPAYIARVLVVATKLLGEISGKWRCGCVLATARCRQVRFITVS